MPNRIIKGILGDSKYNKIKNYLESNDSFVQGENSWITN